MLVDEYLEDWPGREQVKGSPALFVRDGVALAAVLRAELEKRGPHIADPVASKTAIVLRTGHLGNLASGLPRHLWSPAVASRYDLEWVAEKSADAKDFASIAIAAARLPDRWDPADPTAQLEWLALPNGAWAEEAILQIEQCRPPWSALSSNSAGRLWLAWFMQKILPFPTFLVDDLRAAAYLGLRSDALDEVLASATPMGRQLETVVYRGELANFDGRRWWRAGIAAIRRDLLEQSRGRRPRDAADQLSRVLGFDLNALNLDYPVFTINFEYQTLPEPVEAADAVRLQPDGWPAYADDPWLSCEDVSDEPELAKLIVLSDREEFGHDAES